MLHPALPADGERRLAVVPVRSFRDAKMRLRAALTDGERVALVEEMARRVIRTAHAVVPVAVVSADREVLDLAEGLGALPIVERPASGSAAERLNGALEDAVWEAEGLAVHTLAVIFGDLPHLSEDDVAALLRVPARPGVVLAPDHAGTGTNALTVSPPRALRFRFGPGSFRAHLAAAHRARLPVRVLRRHGLATDVDTPDDLARIMRRAALTPATGLSRSVIDRAVP